MIAAHGDFRISARAWLSAKEVFGQRISDHVPQEFTFGQDSKEDSKEDSKGIKVLSWNIMARALCRKKGQGEMSNNGFEFDETIQEYSERLLRKVAPIITSWILQQYSVGTVGKKWGKPWVCCLQEVPGHRHLRRDLLQKVQDGLKDAGVETLQTAELSKASAFMCTVTLWDGAVWDLEHCTHHGSHVLCTVLSSKPCTRQRPPALLRVMNCHLPLPECHADVKDAMAPVLQLLAESPAQQVALVAGDLKLDLGVEGAVQALRKAYQGLAAPAGSPDSSSLFCAVVPGSSLYDWTRGTSDAAILAPGLCNSEAEIHPAVPTGSVLKRWDPLNGLSSEDFIAQCINYNLQDCVRQHLPSLTSDDLGRLGSHHFGDQAEELDSLLSKIQKIDVGVEPERNEAERKEPERKEPERNKADRKGPERESSRQDFIQKHIHRKLWSRVAWLNDEELHLLGLLHFSDQPSELQRLSQRTQPGTRPPAAVCGRASQVEGLAEWLSDLALEDYETAAATWCNDMGAIDLSEVQENAADLAEFLGLHGLRPLERRRLLRVSKSDVGPAKRGPKIGQGGGKTHHDRSEHVRTYPIGAPSLDLGA
eukprot:Skav211166  [mRNA]  locus=scaffold413:568696:570551:+ [translate_table: standard]